MAGQVEQGSLLTARIDREASTRSTPQRLAVDAADALEVSRRSWPVAPTCKSVTRSTIEARPADRRRPNGVHKERKLAEVPDSVTGELRSHRGARPTNIRQPRRRGGVPLQRVAPAGLRDRPSVSGARCRRLVGTRLEGITVLADDVAALADVDETAFGREVVVREEACVALGAVRRAGVGAEPPVRQLRRGEPARRRDRRRESRADRASGTARPGPVHGLLRRPGGQRPRDRRGPVTPGARPALGRAVS